MTISQNYKDAFTEVYTILKYLKENDYKKIPKNFIDIIRENMNVDYKYEINVKIDLSKQQMLKETKAILFKIYRDYLSTEEQKNKIIKIQMRERSILDEKKKLKYDPNTIF